MAGIRSRGMGGGQWQDHPEVTFDRPLNIICHAGNVQIEMSDVVEIDCDMTRYHGNRVVKIDPVAKSWAEHILGYQLERDLQPQDRSDSMAHVIGLCDLPIKLMQKAGRGLPIYVKEPETFLHPSQQCRIADFFSCISQNTNSSTGIFKVMPPGHTDGWMA